MTDPMPEWETCDSPIVFVHLPECPLAEPCRSNDFQEHVMQGTVAGFPVTICGLCMDDCICSRLFARESRVREEYESQDCYTLGRAHGITQGSETTLEGVRIRARLWFAVTFGLRSLDTLQYEKFMTAILTDYTEGGY